MSKPMKLERRELLALVAGLAAVAPARGSAAASSGEIAAVTFIHGLAGRDAELREHLLSLAAPTRAEPGCLQYDLYESDAPAEFLRLERWRSLADLTAHKETPHLRASFEKRTREGWSTEISVWRRAPGDH